MSAEHLCDNSNQFFIGENLEKLRKSYNLKMTEVAGVIGKTRQGYRNYEKGLRDISIQDLITLSGFYNVSLDVLVANPSSLKSDKTLAFRSFETVDDEIQEIMPITISTVFDDVICYKRDNENYLFFWKTNLNQVGHVMIFDYYDKIYVSKVFYNHSGGGHFYINDEPKYFNKPGSENIIFKGVLMADLNKRMDIPCFFD